MRIATWQLRKKKTIFTYYVLYLNSFTIDSWRDKQLKILSIPIYRIILCFKLMYFFFCLAHGMAYHTQ